MRRNFRVWEFSLTASENSVVEKCWRLSTGEKQKKNLQHVNAVFEKYCMYSKSVLLVFCFQERRHLDVCY